MSCRARSCHLRGRKPGLGRSLAGVALLAAMAFAPRPALAAPIFDYVGPLNEANFGGSAIPNDYVAVASQFVDGDVLITVALSATPRFEEPFVSEPPPVGNNGAGVYYAQPGTNFRNGLEGAVWNFSYFIRVEGGDAVLTDYQFTGFYDFDPGYDTPLGQLGVIDITAAALLLPPGTTLVEGSENLMFAALTDGVPGYVTPPAYGSFDPYALGEYTFGIQVTKAGWGLETVAMNVEVVPEPTTVVLLGLGLAGLGSVRRR